PLRQFEQEDTRFFEACLPVEVIARRGRKALAYGPLKPVGLVDPRTGKRPYAVVQLRQDNLAGTLYNMVGFQTNLRWGEQERVFRLIPGLEKAQFVRFGQMHRNTFINAPALLRPTMQLKGRDDLFFGGQITGTEGYVGSTASGLVAGLNAARLITGRPLIVFPPTTMLGALCRYVTSADPGSFQPMKPNFGLMPPLERLVRRKRDRHRAYTQRALADLAAVIAEQMGMEYTPLKCPRCGRAEFETLGENELRCWHCGGKMVLAVGRCPYCGFVNEAEAGFCANCGEGIAWECHLRKGQPGRGQILSGLRPEPGPG
ncbi:MAG TPA: methylenetetrahydrofolate--tRNA-(uracil(54)-C(5))-methyltransferase (FADH(2)-oxidizing) TrmFO, partial [Anaerolineae bacterium]|nr:methylenetetrahydrofolate--tRNA-(uracil(54)-C(5))-methyltransferase (FADH(2)-oxidizing) TrmFO [Anaerolineae bacterium]